MGFFDNLMFWKKKDDGLDLKGLDMPGVGKNMGAGDPFGGKNFQSTAGGFGNTNFGAGQNLGFNQQSFQASPNMNSGFDSGMNDSGGFGSPQVQGSAMQSAPVAQGTGVISSSFGALNSGQQGQDFGQSQQKQFYEAPQSTHPQQFQMPASRTAEIQIIDAKIDSIKATLDSINQRLANIERVAYESREQPPRRPLW